MQNRISWVFLLASMVTIYPQLAAYNTRLRRVVDGAPTSSARGYIGSPLFFQADGNSLLPLDAFQLTVRIYSPSGRPADYDAAFTPELTATTPEYQRIEFFPDPSGDPTRLQLRAVAVADFESPFDDRKITIAAPTSFTPLFTFSIRYDLEAQVSVFFHDLQEFTVNGGVVVFPTVQEQPPGTIQIGGFVRGDANEDRRVSITDVVYLLHSLFISALAWPIPCQDVADANDDGVLDISDAIRILLSLFSEATIPPPFPSIGADPTPDSLPCN